MGGTHGSTMDLFVILTLEEEVCVCKAKLQKCDFLWYGWSFVRVVDPVVVYVLLC